MFKKGIQIIAFLENRPGRFTEFCEGLYEREVDVLAINLHADSEVGILRMVVDDVKGARSFLKAEEIPYMQTEVLLVEGPNKPGMAAGLGHKLTQADIDIEYTYFSGSAKDAPALMVFKVKNLEVALTRLHKSSREYN